MSEDLPNSPQETEVVKTTLFAPSLYGGRFTRMQYLLYSVLGVVILYIGTVLPLIIRVNLFEFGLSNGLMGFVFCCRFLFSLAWFLPIAVKRAHDIGHKGTFIITLWCIGLVAQLLCLVSVDLSQVLTMIFLIPALIYGCILLFKDSDKGANAYGTSTKYPDVTE